MEKKKRKYKWQDKNNSVGLKRSYVLAFKKRRAEQYNNRIQCFSRANIPLSDYGWFTTLYHRLIASTSASFICNHKSYRLKFYRKACWILKYRMASFRGKQNTTQQLKPVISELSIYHQSKDQGNT